MIRSTFPSHGRRALALAALGAAALLAGCTAPGWGTAGASPASAELAASAAPQITAPATNLGTWVELGHVQAPWMAGDAPVPVAGPAAPTRIAGLRREDGRWLAIVLAQVAPAGGAPCPQPNSLHVADVGGASDACLRLRRDADFDRWLERQHSVLYQWLEERGWAARPRAWIGYRVPAAAGGRALETHVLVDPVLLEPTTRTNDDFLAAGQPGREWARAFAAATRAAAVGGALNVPPFPFAPQVAPPPPAPSPAAPVVVAPPPTRAEQLPPPRPPAPAPRRDRE